MFGANLICVLLFILHVNVFLGFDLNRACLNFKIPNLGMASSQVEFASSAPFGCVLRDHNRRERCNFQKNLKDLVRDHLHTCISSSDENNTQNAPRRSNKSDEIQPPEIENSPPTQPESSVEIPNLGGVSSLVQRWRDFADAKIIKKLGADANANVNPIPNPNPNLNATSSSASAAAAGVVCSTSRTSSINSFPESTVESGDERFDTPSTMTEDSFADWESDRITLSRPPSAQSRVDSEEKEKEKLRVADVIRKLTSENQMQGCLMSWKSEQQHVDPPPLENETLPPLRVPRECNLQERCLRVPVLNSPKIRGRQAFSDLLMQLERDRLRELDALMERRAVSKFSHRGRIQACLRLRFMLRDAANQQQAQPKPMGSSKQHMRREEANLPPKRPSKSKVVDPQHSNSTAVVPQRQPSRGKALQRDQTPSREKEVGAQQQSDPQPSNSTVVVPQRQPSRGKALGKDQSSSREKEVGAQQQSDDPTTISIQQHSSSGVIDRDQQSDEAVRIDRLPSEPRPLKQSSAVILLREKFDALIENEPSDIKTSRGVKPSEASAVSSSSNQVREEPCHQPEITIDQQSVPSSAENSASHASEDVLEPNSDKACEGTSSVQDHKTEPQDEVERLTCSHEHEEIMKAEERKESEHVTSDHPREEPTFEEEIIMETANVLHVASEHPMEDEHPTFEEMMDTEQDWASEASQAWTEWGEQEYNDHMMGTSHDWITDIARPRSDWEDLRQARYQEMLDPYTENEDIRRLLERRSVSTFLSSNMRETMDQLMMSRMEILPQAIQTHREDNQGFHNRLEQLMMSHIQRQQTHTNDSPEAQTIGCEQEDEEHEEVIEGEHEEEREEDDDVAEEEEEHNNVEEVETRTVEHHHQYGEVDSFLDQAPADVRPWSGTVDVSYDSDQVSSPWLQQPLSSHSSHQDRPFSSCTNRSSMEMELMYYFRGHMEQLHQEMQELRKTINSCMTMQEEMQKAIKQEVAAALNQSVAVREVGKESRNGLPKKGSCCICYDVKVDCLLYRCGHMCTCFKCALELQWSSGKCPICRAPIVDVVRAYADT